MTAFITYDATTGVVRGTVVANHNGDEAALIAANTPAGCLALAVAQTDPVFVNQDGWVVRNGALVLVPPTDAELLASAQTVQSSTIEAAYQNAAFSTAIGYKGTTFWTDQNSQSMLTGALVVFGPIGAVPADFKWWDATGNGVPMTLADLQGLAGAILSNVNTCFVKRKTLLATVAAATVVAAAQAVVW